MLKRKLQVELVDIRPCTRKNILTGSIAQLRLDPEASGLISLKLQSQFIRNVSEMMGEGL